MAVMTKVRTTAMAIEVPSMTDSETAGKERPPCCGLSTSFISAVKQHVMCALLKHATHVYTNLLNT